MMPSMTRSASCWSGSTGCRPAISCGRFRGAVDEGETPLQAAKRELVEETGFRAKSGKSWFRSTRAPDFWPKK